MEDRIVPPSLIREPKKGEMRYAIVGEAPGEWETYEGAPFVGQSGKLLRETLKCLELDPNSIFLTNVLNRRPLGDAPSADEIILSRDRLFAELDGFRPDRILLLGASAMNAFWGADKCILKVKPNRSIWHDFELPSGKIAKVMLTWHPAAVLRDAGYFRDFSRDIERFSSRIENFTPPKRILVENIADLQ